MLKFNEKKQSHINVFITLRRRYHKKTFLLKIYALVCRQSHSTQDEADFSPRLSILPELEPHALPGGKKKDFFLEIFMLFLIFVF